MAIALAPSDAAQPVDADGVAGMVEAARPADVDAGRPAGGDEGDGNEMCEGEHLVARFARGRASSGRSNGGGRRFSTRPRSSISTVGKVG